MRMVVILFLIIGGLPQHPLLSQDSTEAQDPKQAQIGSWDCYLDSPGGKLKFGLDVESNDGVLAGFLVNGSERISIPSINVGEELSELRIDHYDSVITFKTSGVGQDKRLTGNWRKRRGKSKWVEMQFHATKSVGSKSSSSANATTDNQQSEPGFSGRWAVDFAESSDPAVGVFEVESDGTAGGTFMTTTGDYRFLAGTVSGKTLELSCFDGAHAFLFRSTLDAADKISGEFWSSDSWHEKWTATRAADAKLPDAFAQTKVTDQKTLGDCKFPDLSGETYSLDDPKFDAKAKLIYVFGSWCPNCHDAAVYFKELQAKYDRTQLSIIGLAFEHTGEFERDAEQVRKYLKRHQVNYPVLIAGLSDKKLASQQVPFLDKVRSYPTTIFIDGKNNMRAIHTGFTGPATGAAYDRLKSRFEETIDQIIGEK